MKMNNSLKKLKRFLTAALTVALSGSMLVASAFAADQQEPIEDMENAAEVAAVLSEVSETEEVAEDTGDFENVIYGENLEEDSKEETLGKELEEIEELYGEDAEKEIPEVDEENEEAADAEVAEGEEAREDYEIAALASSTMSLDDENIWINFASYDSTYTGSAITPTMTVKRVYNQYTIQDLTLGTDYTVSYSNNVNVGTATVTIKGKGNYTGTVTKTFYISARKLDSSFTIKLSKSSYTYDGTAKKPSVTLTDSNGVKLSSSDYTVTYQNNTNAGMGAAVYVKGTGNYTDTISTSFTINPVDLSDAKVTLSTTSYTYDGTAKKPAVKSVKLGSDTLIAGTDYSVSYSSNTNAGTAKVKVKGVGNYTGTATATFTIKGGTGSSSSGSSSTLNGVCKASDGNWYYYKNGVKQTSYTGFGSNSNGKWYIEKGKVTKKTNGVFKDTTGAIGSKNEWYYVVGSKVQTSFTGLADYSNASGWWYITKGKVDRSYNGLAKNKNGWFYLKNGKVDRSYTGLATNSNGTWYVKNGKVQKTWSGTVTLSGKTYTVKNGKVSTSSSSSSSSSSKLNGVCKASDGNWYYYKNGVKQTSYTGFGSNSNGKWYIEKGKVTKKTNGVFKDTTGAIGSKNEWYYVVGSKVQTSFTGLADYSNASGWWYITKGKVDRSYNGLAKNKNGWYYLTNGKVDRSYTGLATNSNGTWYVKNGKVQKSYSGTVNLSGKAYTVKNGKVTTTSSSSSSSSSSSLNGVCKASNGNWYYYKNGVIQYSYSGFQSNSNGTWYIKSGKVDKSYSGTLSGVHFPEGQYSKDLYFYIKDGKLQEVYREVDYDVISHSDTICNKCGAPTFTVDKNGALTLIDGGYAHPANDACTGKNCAWHNAGSYMKGYCYNCGDSVEYYYDCWWGGNLDKYPGVDFSSYAKVEATSGACYFYYKTCSCGQNSVRGYIKRTVWEA